MTDSNSTKSYLLDAVASFPPGIRFACAYGSGVFMQNNQSPKSSKVVDFMFAVNDTELWHKENLELHWHHYSFLKRFGSRHIASVQKNHGAKVYFNTHVIMRDKEIKYGVIDAKDFLLDLHKWESLYVAGRLHKPVVILQGLDDADIMLAMTRNLDYALSAALLTLPDKFTEEKLFMKICSLSYDGDPRMLIGEDRRKVENIVLPNMDKFRQLYSGAMQRKQLYISSSNVEQDMSLNIHKHYLLRLPMNLRRRIVAQLQIPAALSREQVQQHVEQFLQDRDRCRKVVNTSVAAIVRTASVPQTLKGIFTAGFVKSVSYSGRKLLKMFRGMLRL